MHISERISALLDDAGDRTDEAALAEIAREPAARQTWARYQFIGEGLRAGAGPLPSPDFRSRVAAALERESPALRVTPPAAAIRRHSRLRRPALALAAAASVVALVFSGWYAQSRFEGPSILQAQTGAPEATLATAPEANNDAQRVSVLSEQEYQRRINSYLVNFNEQRAQLGVPGVHPYVRVVGFESAPRQ